MVEHATEQQHIGRQVGNYRLRQFLGMDKTASLFLGEHLYLQTQALVKLYDLHLQYTDQQSFLAEAQAIARLVHPHILRVLEFGMEDETPFLITAYANGGTLRQRYPSSTRMPLPLVSAYASQIAQALDYAHSQGIVHLAVRPEHVWFKRDQKIALSDFRTTFFSTGSRSESLIEIAEAVAYMAPEQIRGHASPASDQYALGIMVYEWLCGSHPFIGATYFEVARQHLQTAPPLLVGRVPNISGSLEQVLIRALAKEPVERFPSLLAFAEALEQSLHVSARSSPRSWPEEAVTAPLSQRSAVRSAGESEEKQTRRAVTLGLIGLAGAAVVGGGITWFVRSSGAAHGSKKTALPPKQAKAGTTFFTYQGHTDLVYAVDWSKDGKNIASWSQDDTMQIWSASTFAARQTYSLSNIVSWSPDWRLMASGGAGGFEVWELANGHTIFAHDFENTGAGGPPSISVNTLVQWSPDGNSLVSSFDNTLVWRVDTGKTLFSDPTSFTTWSPDGKRLALQKIVYIPTNAPVEVQIIDLASENQLASYKITDVGILWSPDGKYLVSGNGSIWNALNGKLVVRYKGKAKPIRCIWSPDSKYLALFDDSEYAGLAYNRLRSITADPTVRIWSASTGEELLIYRGHQAGVNYVAWAPDSKRIASASADKTVKVWQAVGE